MENVIFGFSTCSPEDVFFIWKVKRQRVLLIHNSHNSLLESGWFKIKKDVHCSRKRSDIVHFPTEKSFCPKENENLQYPTVFCFIKEIQDKLKLL